eukprot:CAMPEP_0113697834 /NCGR_PEP_ID=MMETSP0038_2-20120614/22359_1 /TAXON_ID=2898 /ORGANISM="Cryptomonas paramecium" /LENGTH=291 /DNA_ID=CAMNT_0000620899 /DNA_START=65 /DNA_END=936 /DNA_ORIENTATION=- /assembly_acc=CAM_ASM_000170
MISSSSHRDMQRKSNVRSGKVQTDTKASKSLSGNGPSSSHSKLHHQLDPTLRGDYNDDDTEVSSTTGRDRSVSDSSQPSSTSRPIKSKQSSRKFSSNKAAETKTNNELWMIGPVVDSSSRSDGNPEFEVVDFRSERVRKIQVLPHERDRECLFRLEHSLMAMLKDRDPSGSDVSRFVRAFENLGLEYNVMAMKYLQNGSNAMALDLLKAAESVISEASAFDGLESLQGLTYNNLGCYYRREGMPMEALEWLRRAHEMEQRCGDPRTRASTFLNLTAVYSLLSRHADALESA